MRQTSLSPLAVVLLLAVPALAQSDPDRKLSRITSTFTYGWGSEDGLPTSAAAFDQLAAVVADADFTTVLCNWADWKLPILRAHGLDMMVNVYGDSDGYHILSAPAPVLALAAGLKDTPGIWGYALALDLTSLTAGYNTALNSLHGADPNHPALISWQAGSWPYARNFSDPDVISYYYYIWYTNGTPNYKNQFYYLNAFRNAAAAEGAPLQQMPVAYQGPSADGTNYKNRFSVYTALAFGARGFHWFLANNWINTSTLQWTSGGLGMKTLNAELKALSPELLKLTSTTVYSTPTTLTALGLAKDSGEPAIPSGLVAIPADHWLQVAAGEVAIGEFNDQSIGDTFMVVNHRVCTPNQAVTLRFTRTTVLFQTFNRATGVWDDTPLSGSPASASVSFSLAPGDGLLMRAFANLIPGDATLNGVVDLQDFSLLKAHYNLPGHWCQGDFNGDALVDLQDFSLLKAHYNQSQASAVPVVAIPEPATLGLLLLCSLPAILRRRRK